MGSKGTCVLCERKDVAVLDGRLASGEALSAVAREMRIPKATLYTHWKRCRLAGKVRARVSAEAAPIDPALLEPLPIPMLPPDDPRAGTLVALANVHRIAQEAYQRAHESQDGRAIALLIPQMRMNLVKAIDIALKGRRDDQSAAERLMANPEFAAASVVLFGVLDRHPEAKADVIEALTEWIGGEA